MAKVPYKATPSVAFEPASLPPFSARGADSAAFAAPGKALAGLGAELSQLGDVLYKHQLKEQDLQNDAQANELFLWADMERGKEEIRYDALEGRDKFDGYNDHVKNLEKIRQDGIDRAGTNPVVKRKFDNSFTPRLGNTILKGAGEASRAKRKYESDASTSRVDNAISDTAANWQDENRFQQNIATVKIEITKQADMHGWDDAVYKDKTLEATSKVWAARIGAVAQTNPIIARKMYEANKDSISGLKQIDIDKALNSADVNTTTRIIGDSIEAGDPDIPSYEYVPGTPIEVPGRAPRPQSSLTPGKPPGYTPEQQAAIRGKVNVARIGPTWGDPLDPGFTKNYITQISTAGGKSVAVHKIAAPYFQGFIRELETMGYSIRDIGGHAVRTIAGTGGRPSQHAWGNAIDINPDQNPVRYGQVVSNLPPNVGEIAAKWGLSWGGDWKTKKDSMHFEFVGMLPQGGGSFISSDATPPQPEGKGPPAVRFNNPGNMWMGDSAKKFGAQQSVSLSERDKPAVFPDRVSGAAAMFDLLASNKYSGLTVEEAIYKWAAGRNPAYPAFVEKQTGVPRNTVLTRQLLESPEGIKVAKAMARYEAGVDYPLSEQGWAEARSRALGHTKPVQVASLDPTVGIAPATNAAPTGMPNEPPSGSQLATAPVKKGDWQSSVGKSPPDMAVDIKDETKIGRVAPPAVATGEEPTGGIPQPAPEITQPPVTVAQAAPVEEPKYARDPLTKDSDLGWLERNLDKARDIARRIAPNNPAFEDKLLADIEARYNRVKRTRSLAERELNYTVQAKIMGDFGPKMVRNLDVFLADPNNAEMWGKLSIGKQKEFEAQIRKNAAADVPRSPEADAKRLELLGLSNTDRERFKTLGPADYGHLPRAYQADIVQKQQSLVAQENASAERMKKQVDKDNNLNAYLRHAHPILAAAGIAPDSSDPGKMTLYNTFIGASMEEIEQYERDNKKPLTAEKEMKEIATKLIRTVDQWSPFGITIPGTGRRAFELPGSWKNPNDGQVYTQKQWKEQYQKRFGKEPSEQDMYRIYKWSLGDVIAPAPAPE